VVTLNEAVVDISVAIPLEYVELVNGPVRYAISTPPGTARSVILNDAGYNGYGSDVVFTDLECADDPHCGVDDGKISTTVRVEIPLDRKKLAPGEIVPAELSVITTGDTVTTTVDVTVKDGTTNTLVVDTVITEPLSSTTDALN
jgi:hypothetical protein